MLGHSRHRRLRALASLLFAGTMLSTPLRAEDPKPGAGAEPPPIGATPPSSEGSTTTEGGAPTGPGPLGPAGQPEMHRIPLTVVECLNMAGDAAMDMMSSTDIPEEMFIARDQERDAKRACNEDRMEDAGTLIRGMKMQAKESREAKGRYTKESSEPSKPCFLTASCCELVGLADDCFELRTLRRYRDEVLAEMPGGRGDIERYYGIAPVILASIRRKGRKRELLVLYFTHVLPSAVLARVGLNRTARRLYTHMMRVLYRRHIPDATKPMALA